MSLHFVTGTAGEDHITGDDWGHLNAGIVGSGSYVLKTGNRLKATVASANSITISDGDAVMMGRHVRLSSPESVAIESGTIGQKRNDIIAIRYAKTSNGDLQKEAATLVAVKGTPSTGTPDDPETDSSDILSGATTAEMPLYRIPIDGVTVGTPVPLFDVLTPAAEVWDSVSRMTWNEDVRASTKWPDIQVHARSRAGITMVEVDRTSADGSTSLVSKDSYVQLGSVAEGHRPPVDVHAVLGAQDYVWLVMRVRTTGEVEMYAPYAYGDTKWANFHGHVCYPDAWA